MWGKYLPDGGREVCPAQLECKVVPGGTGGEVLLGAVDDVVGAEAPHEGDVLGATGAGHLGTRSANPAVLATRSG